MTVLVPTRVDDALTLLAEDPRRHVLAGGTDFMVEVNYGARRPLGVVSLRSLDELRGWRRRGDELILGAGLRFVDMLRPEFLAVAPGLAQAARTVGSAQIRSTGTLGGNIATASPAGDALPVLYALDAAVSVASVRGERTLPISELIIGVKQTTLADDELILSNREGIVFDPAFMWIKLLELALRHANDMASIVKYNSTSVRRTLIECNDMVHGDKTSSQV